MAMKPLPPIGPRPVPRLTSFLTAVVGLAATNAPTALYSVWRAQMGFSATVQTVAFAIYVAGLVPALMLTGALLGRISPRRLMMTGTLAAIAAALVLAVTSTAPVLIGARLAQGLAVGVVMSASSAALTAATPPRPRSFTALLITLTAAIGAAGGPVLAGVLADAFDRSTSIPMLCCAGLLVGCVVLLAAHGATTPAEPRRSAVDTVPPAADAAPGGLGLTSLTAGLSWGVVGVYQSIGPSLIGQTLEVSSLGALGAIVAIVLAVSGIVQVLSRRLPVPTSRRLGLIFLLLGIAAFAAMLLTGSLILALVAALATGIGHGFSYFSATQEVGELIRHHPRCAGRWTSRYFIIAYLCLAATTVTLGVLGDVWNLTIAALSLMGVIATGCLAMLLSTNRPSQHKSTFRPHGSILAGESSGAVTNPMHLDSTCPSHGSATPPGTVTGRT
jgi:hypothetical protein